MNTVFNKFNLMFTHKPKRQAGTHFWEGFYLSAITGLGDSPGFDFIIKTPVFVQTSSLNYLEELMVHDNRDRFKMIEWNRLVRRKFTWNEGL